MASVGDEQARGEQQRVARQEEPEQQAALGEDDQCEPDQGPRTQPRQDRVGLEPFGAERDDMHDRQRYRRVRPSPDAGGPVISTAQRTLTRSRGAARGRGPTAGRARNPGARRRGGRSSSATRSRASRNARAPDGAAAGGGGCGGRVGGGLGGRLLRGRRAGRPGLGGDHLRRRQLVVARPDLLTAAVAGAAGRPEVGSDGARSCVLWPGPDWPLRPCGPDCPPATLRPGLPGPCAAADVGCGVARRSPGIFCTGDFLRPEGFWPDRWPPAFCAPRFGGTAGPASAAPRSGRRGTPARAAPRRGGARPHPPRRRGRRSLSRSRLSPVRGGRPSTAAPHPVRGWPSTSRCPG